MASSVRGETTWNYPLHFRGGGARVIELMAAAEALRELSSAGLEVFRVSGASAGAIAAAMFATECDIGAIVSQPDKLKAIVRRHFSDDRFRKRNTVWRLVRGLPIFDEAALGDALIALFELGGVDARRPIRDIVRSNIQLRILRSNIRYHNSSVATEESEFQLWEALADSASIPFAFKMPGTRGRTPEILDGGLFQNLPAHAATEGLGANQIPLGFSFEKEPAPDLTKASVSQYAAAVINSMLSERIEDSAQRIKPSNIVLIPNRRRTFDFESIFTDDLYKNFRETVGQVKILTDGWRKSVEMLDGPDWYSEHPDDLREHIRLTDLAVMDFFDANNGGYHAEEIHHEIVFNSHNQTEADLCLLHVRLLGSKNVGLQFLRFWFFDSKSGPLKRATIEVSDGQGNAIPALIFPVRNTGKPRSRSILLVLPKALADGGEFSITKAEESFATMLDYLTEGQNFQTLGMGVGRSADTVKLSVHFPKALKPKFFRDASRENSDEEKDFEGDTGLQVGGTYSTSQSARAGCFTVLAKAQMPQSAAEERRFLKVVYSGFDSYRGHDDELRKVWISGNLTHPRSTQQVVASGGVL